MADTYYSSLDSEVFDDQIVPDTDDCFLPPSEAPLSSGAWNFNVSISLSNHVITGYTFI